MMPNLALALVSIAFASTALHATAHAVAPKGSARPTHAAHATVARKPLHPKIATGMAIHSHSGGHWVRLAPHKPAAAHRRSQRRR